MTEPREPRTALPLSDERLADLRQRTTDDFYSETWTRYVAIELLNKIDRVAHERDALNAENVALTIEIDRLKAENAAERARIRLLRAEIDRLKAENAALALADARRTPEDNHD
jgi:uncharacterized small protein (DUF1192 family)